MEEGRWSHRRWALALVLVAALAGAATPANAAAQTPPPLQVPSFGQFRSVLAQGEGQTVTTSDYGRYLSTGDPPDSFVNQQPLYAGIMPVAGSLTPSDVDSYYKDTNFGSVPGGTESVESPRPGVHIYRDGTYDMAHIYGDNRYDVMFGAGYATAEERLFFMDVLRRTAKGQLAGLLGPSAASDDADQLTDQDFSDQELDQQFNRLDQRFGHAGEKTQSDLLAYVDGINARIAYDKAHADAMPVEYLGLNAQPRNWTVSDTAAMAVMLVTQFTVSNGGEEVNAQLQQAFRKRFGKRWQSPYHDLREANDPEAYVVAKRPFLSDRPGPVSKGLNAKPDFGSITPRDAQVSSGTSSAKSSGSITPRDAQVSSGTSSAKSSGASSRSRPL